MPCTLAVVTLGGARVYGPVLGAEGGVDIGTRVRVIPLELLSPDGETLTAFAFAEDLAA